MTTMQRKLPRYATDYNYTTDEGWSMRDAERIEITNRAQEYENAGNMEAYEKEMRKIPLAPNIAWMLRDHLGKKEFLEQGYNLRDAEIAYGKDWVDEYEVVNDNKGCQDE